MKYVLRYFLCGLVLCACVYAAQARFGKGQGAYVQTIGSIAYSGPTDTPGLANTPLGSASVTMFQATPAFSGTCSLSGANASSFTINPSTCALRVGAANLAFGVYGFNIVATQAGIANSPLSLPVSIGVPAWYVAQSTRCANANGGSGTQATCALPASYTGDTLVVMPDWCEAAPCASGTAVRPSSVTINNGTATCTEISGALTPTSGSAIHGADAWLCSNLSAAADSVKVVFPSSVGRADLNIQELYGCAPACIAEGGHGIQIAAPAGSSPSISLGSPTTAAFDLILSFLGSGDGAGLSAGACCTALTGDAGNLSEFQVGATAQSYTNSAVYTGSALAYGTIGAFKQTTSPPLVASPNVISPTSFSVVSNAPAGTLVGTITATTVPNYFFVGEMLLATNAGGYLVLAQPAKQPNMATLKVANGVTLTAGTYTDTVQLIENGVTVNQNFTLTVTSPQTIASITCSGCSTSFTANIPNGVVGNVTVAMSPASPAFSGTLSITGSNSGGFQLSGTSSGSNLLQSTIGTPPSPPGGYTDTNIVATEAGVGNSPQQITPTLTGVAPGGQPPQAAAAGFAAQVLKADFTSGGSVVVGGSSIALTPTSGYITNCGAADSQPNLPTTWHFTFFHWANNSERMPCPDTAIATDPVSGGQVLASKVTVSDYAGSDLNVNNGAVLGFPSPGGAGVNTSWLPNEIYTKIVLRLDSSSFNQGSNIWGLFDWWGSTTAYGTAWVDIDVAEIAFGGTSPCGGTVPAFYGQLNEADHTQPIVYSGTLCASVDPTQYHTLEALTTSDESTTLSFCEWFDGAFAGCKSPFPLSYDSGYAYTLRDRSLWLAHETNGASSILNDVKVYTKSIEIWTCANYKTSTCPGTIVDHWPFP